MVDVDRPEVDGPGVDGDDDEVHHTEGRPEGCVCHLRNRQGKVTAEEDPLAESWKNLRRKRPQTLISFESRAR